MDAHTLYRIMKPHLDGLAPSEKDSLTKLINTRTPGKVTCHHRKIHSLSKAKEYLKNFCRREMERERQDQSPV
ncbi:hypothetical protein [Salinimicrobium oceani]|uniref:Uncharacterized protein n=1 Tax=Salinimicrobium oceani TaxID=2722702 RepID=A0ABX1CXF2_9FLAO|nr:hypothetical protein [Salinimicrobium oceani]NJW51346.1 hypothetical protein [Salinimicrobium oceani]